MKTPIRKDIWEQFAGVCAANYPIPPERIANALLYDFSLHPPKELTLVRRAATADDDNEGDEWKRGDNAKRF